MTFFIDILEQVGYNFINLLGREKKGSEQLSVNSSSVLLSAVPRLKLSC